MSRKPSPTATAWHIDGLSYAELLNLRNIIDHRLAEKRGTELSNARQRIAAVAKEHGFKVPELLGSKRKGRKLGKVPPKYANPRNPQQTWTGRGRPPLWMGQNRKNFLIGR